ncbi:hypothetical protein IEQ34_022221 [Dendrobium chrysotoxum]|uniref:Zinc-ribbon domain-containing protein n=1 Tax=Dendrobium chrysotoxum TaxID=161865 RepID=A0AAV7FWM5_DENCH|nr:hypothetical protein IEQ34_022221 [Dendrobium chrysotoxum]
MAEGEGGVGAKVRVVRCPKCDKLLPELANFTVYRCGGCDATLQAKKQPTVFEASPEKSDEDVSKCSEKNSEVDVESDRLEFKKEQQLNKTCDDSLISGNEKRDSLNEGESPRMDSLPTSKSEARDGNFQHRSMGYSTSPGDNVDGLVRRKMEEIRETKAQVLFSNGHSKFRPTKAWEGEELNNMPAFRGTPKLAMGDTQAASYPVAGPSNYNCNLSHINSEGAAKRQNIEGSDRVELLEQDRAELLRKLDELRDQIKLSCEVVDAPKERVPANNMSASLNSHGHNGRGSWFPDGSSALNRNSSHHSSFSNGHNVDMPRFYPAAHLQNGVHGYRENSRPYSLAPCNLQGQYPQRSSNSYIYGQLDPDPVSSYHNDGFYHQPACACMHCYAGHWLPPAQVTSSFLSNLRVPPCPLGNHGFYAADGPSMFGSQAYNHRIPKAPLHSYEPRNQPKAAFTRKERRPCRPVAGAAPFIVCYNCSELLQIPEEILQMGKHHHKLRCGSCSQLISFELDGRKLFSSNNISNLPATSENKVDLNDGSKDILQCHGNINRRQVISYSIDYDSPNYFDVRSADEKIVMPAFPVSSNEVVEKECGLNLSDSEKLHGLCSSSSTSGGVESPDSVICPRDAPSSTELPVEVDAITRVPSLPLREHFGYPSGNKIVDDPGSGSRSKRSDQERVTSYTGNFKQNSVKDVPVATEMDLSAEDYPNAGFSQDSWDVSKEEEEPRFNKGGDSFLTGLIKKSFKDFSPFSQSTESGRSKVSVNGRSISDRLVKRAEKLAGPIHPGYYWYDYRAGFWGVMGHACLGIIPPFIEEFNYPMQKNCAAGNTGILVNGRELNDKDLTLLASRGLPVTQGRSYIIEISGKVWDEETGEELDCLGKLAPTVERVKRGFGMRAPRVNS